jgi:5-methylcytosine-specific restriction endonuclease McrA
VWSCAYCDCAFNKKVVPEVDHVRPLAKGGLHEWSNFAPACAWCNRTKGDQDVVKWLVKTTGESLTVERAADT